MMLHDNKNSFKKDNNLICFNHSFKKPCPQISLQPSDSFSTVYRDSLISWEVQIEKCANLRSFLHPNSSTDPKYQIVLSHTGLREKYPPPVRVEFTVRILDERNNEFVPPLKHRLTQQEFEDAFFRVDFRTPETSPISKLFVRSLINPDFGSKYVEISTIIEFKTTDLISMEYLTINQAPPVPIELDFRFNSIIDIKRHNFVLRTRLGKNYDCNKESLFVASKWFREFLTPAMTGLTLEVDHLEAIDTAITFLLSEHFKSPEKMTPKLAGEIILLNKFFTSRRSKFLRDSVERQCYDELLQNHEDLQQVVEWLIVSREFMLMNLEGACVACIVSMHYQTFSDKYSDNVPPEPEYDFLRESTSFQPSLISVVNNIFHQSQGVRSFLRKVPTN